ncbi:uncharacterized protein [Aegilops tauschii subsp. strangulata]|uniref:uncharacterized protein n=1 Tax=Aegilops tauschii subsp. strangulata TaxID=200361 RepID=UPI000989F5A1|nr:nucleolar and coiled-body phosphoprotein 1-like [Aegilops tauschii subsp. strangulata]
MSDQSDSQNKSEEQVNMSEGTSPSRSYDEGSRSTPSNFPKAATRTRRKRNSDYLDEDYVAAEEEVNSKKKVVKKEFGTTASTKPSLNKKAPAKRVPMSKARASTLEASKSTVEEAAGEGKKRKERVKKTMAKVICRSSMMRDPAEDEEEDEEQDVAPRPKAQKLMGDAIKSGAAPSKPKTASKSTAQASKSAPKRSTRNIPAAKKNKAPVPEVEEEEEAQDPRS